LTVDFGLGILLEFVSNLVWLLAALSLLGFTYREVRAGSVRLSMASALMLAFVLCTILLPVISLSDDLLATRQAALPQSEKSWRLASHDAAAGVATLLAFAAYLMMLLASPPQTGEGWTRACVLRPMAAILVRSQRLRPPPAFA
jgi:hypothetical protein